MLIKRDFAVLLYLPCTILLQAKTEDLVTADYEGNGGWGDDNPSVFLLSISGRLQGEYQITNGYGPLLAPQVMKVTNSSIINPFLISNCRFFYFINLLHAGTLEHIHSRRRFQVHKKQWTQRSENPSRLVDC